MDFGGVWLVWRVEGGPDFLVEVGSSFKVVRLTGQGLVSVQISQGGIRFFVLSA